MENVDGYSVERRGDEVDISFYDIFGVGEVFTFPLRDARRIRNALTAAIGPTPEDVAAWESEGGSMHNDSC